MVWSGWRRILLVGSLLVLLALEPAWAHDTWLVPQKFWFVPGETAHIALNTSEAFPTSEVAAQPDRILSYEVLSGSSRRPVTGYRVEGNSLVADVTFSEAGVYLVGAQTRPRRMVMEAKQFTEYLTEESLEVPLRARKESGQEDTPGRELYAKAAKLALCVGPREALAGPGGGGQPIGLRLEIIPLKNPCRLAAGDRLRVRALFEGKPLAGASLHASYPGLVGHRYALSQRSDSRGEAEFLLDRPGAWFVRVLHMVSAKAGGEADWESVFATLTFEVR